MAAFCIHCACKSTEPRLPNINRKIDSLKTARKVGYLLKTYPRFSQTFILNEILEYQRAGNCVEIFALRRPKDGRFHECGLPRSTGAALSLPFVYSPHLHQHQNASSSSFHERTRQLPSKLVFA